LFLLALGSPLVGGAPESLAFAGTGPAAGTMMSAASADG